MKIIVADPTGVCFGVKRAAERLEEILKTEEVVYALGSPIHNPQEIERLEKIGLAVVDSPEEVPLGAVAFVRAHGITPQAFAELEKKCSLVVDGTCPFVKTAQKRAEALSKDGYLVVISGDETHPEVRAIVGFAEDAEGEVVVIPSGEAIPDRAKGRRCGILSQTTQKADDFALLVQSFVYVSPEIKVYNTICGAALARQESIYRLAPKVDGIIIIGGRNSANTGKLVDIAAGADTPVLWIEHAGELDRRWLLNREIIGIAAGGSTPDWLITDLIKKLQMM